MSLLGKLFGSTKAVTPTHLQTWADFEQHVLRSEQPVIVDVWSPTCAPCRKLASVLTRVATKYAGRVAVAELDTSAEPRLLAHLGVRATPTLIIYEAGTEIGRMSGFRPEGWFDDMIATEFPDADR